MSQILLVLNFYVLNQKIFLSPGYVTYLVLDKYRINEEMGCSGSRKELCVNISEKYWEALLDHVYS